MEELHGETMSISNRYRAWRTHRLSARIARLKHARASLGKDGELDIASQAAMACDAEISHWEKKLLSMTRADDDGLTGTIVVAIVLSVIGLILMIPLIAPMAIGDGLRQTSGSVKCAEPA
jgi:hypothetical protein